MSSRELAMWESLFLARTGAEFSVLLRDVPSAPTRVIRGLLDRQGQGLMVTLRAEGLPADSLSGALSLGLTTSEQVMAVGQALQGGYSYRLRLSLITALGRAPRGLGVFPILRDHFWRVDAATDTQMSSERFSCWAANYRHSTLDDVDDLIKAARAVEHGHHRGMAVEALGRFKRRAGEFEGLLVALIDEPGVEKHAVAAARKLKLTSAVEPIRRLSERSEDSWLRQECTAALRALEAG
jgi:hypothetical protein